MSSSNSSHDSDSYKNHDDYDYCDDDCIQPWVAYLIWFIIFIVLIAILRAFQIRWFSTIVFSLIVSLIVLGFIYPFNTNYKTKKYEWCSDDAFFGFLCVITIVLLIIWIIWKVFTDRDCYDVYKQVANQATSSGNASWFWGWFSSDTEGQTVATGHGSVSKSASGASSVHSSVTKATVPANAGSVAAVNTKSPVPF
jgi:magnesium-transporting ATPase (P-type)